MKRLTLVGKESGSLGIGLFGFAPDTTVSKAIRLLFLLILLMALQTIQSVQRPFIYVELFLPLYGMLAVSFLVNGLYLGIERLAKNHWPAVFLFAYDTVLITAFLYYSGQQKSLLLFLYLMNILLCGLTFGRKGAYLLALWTSLLFSFLTMLSPSTFVMASLVINNLAFFTLAFLTGGLSQQLSEMGERITSQQADIAALTDFNELIVDNIATGLVTCDLQGEINHSNRAALQILDDVRLTGKNLRLVFPEIFEKIQSNEILREQKELKRFEVEYHNSRQEKLIIEVIISPLIAAGGVAEGYVLLLQDLTQIKNLEKSLRQKEKLAAVGQLAAGIAHEIRNPLASISGSIQLLSTGFDNISPEQAKLMTITVREIDRLNHLISEFLEYVRPNVVLEDPIDMKFLMREVLDIVRVNQSLPSGIEQKTTLASHKVVLGNYDKLKQALLNVVINAYQAMEKTETKELTVQTYDKESSVVVVVKDTGIGMNENELQRIFEPFHTTKPRGTGLGLAVTHKILESHEAKVSVESEPNVGTTFIIEFPAADQSFQDRVALKKHA